MDRAEFYKLPKPIQNEMLKDELEKLFMLYDNNLEKVNEHFLSVDYLGFFGKEFQPLDEHKEDRTSFMLWFKTRKDLMEYVGTMLPYYYDYVRDKESEYILFNSIRPSQN